MTALATRPATRVMAWWLAGLILLVLGAALVLLPFKFSTKAQKVLSQATAGTVKTSSTTGTTTALTYASFNIHGIRQQFVLGATAATVTVPTGVGAEPRAYVPISTRGSTRISAKPGLKGRTPNPHVTKSAAIQLLHAWQSLRVGSGYSGQVVTCLASASRHSLSTCVPKAA